MSMASFIVFFYEGSNLKALKCTKSSCCGHFLEWGDSLSGRTAATSGVIHYEVHYSLACEREGGWWGWEWAIFLFCLQHPLFPGPLRMQCNQVHRMTSDISEGAGEWWINLRENWVANTTELFQLFRGPKMGKKKKNEQSMDFGALSTEDWGFKACGHQYQSFPKPSIHRTAVHPDQMTSCYTVCIAKWHFFFYPSLGADMRCEGKEWLAHDAVHQWSVAIRATG